ncbi:olfactory receptor 11G2-like [Carettochelys insculpta]|uniref:olfactory receptor 11G2-like n=1 Tax=Carettochelys insculpta TaxID=44489 RepID=UPI003EB8B783
MNLDNGSIPVTQFVLLGFPSLGQQSRILLCALLSMAYVGTVVGNFCIVWAVLRDPRLHHLPMYILLGNFSWLEICYISSTVPRMLSDLPSPGVPISFHGCFLQFYFFFSMGATECLLLSSMALDRYLAICHPLRYSILMSLRLCWALVTSCWLLGFLWFIGPILLVSQLSFCSSNSLDHFLCDTGPLLAASCAPPPWIELTCSTMSSLMIFSTIIFILASYGLVLGAVIRLPTGASRHKAVSTCTSHLAVVGLFYGSIMITYVNPAASGGGGKVVTLFYTVGTPLLNPLIYSLRNKEMKEALRRTLLGKR